MRVLPGRPYPLGVRHDGDGVHVAVFAEHAVGVDLCLFDAPLGATESARIPLPARTGYVWHGDFPDLRPGQLYGFRVHGPWAPADGHRCNPHKLLIDPHALAVAGRFHWHPSLFDHSLPQDTTDLSALDRQMDVADSAPFAPKAVVIDERFDWGDDRPPRIHARHTVIYECHVGALTARHPGVPPEQRGTYLGLASRPVIEHLLSLGVTSVELLPVQHFITEQGVAQRGLENAWGYNPLAWFAPHAGYASGDRGQQVTEFRQMVKALHAAGLEVLLDVVFNHTAESGALGPTLSLRGFDNRAYYRLQPSDLRRCVDYTGCGNTPDLSHRVGLQVVLDCLRHWVTAMHVDGFRFDLAPALGRGPGGEHGQALWNAMLQDPVLAQVRLIAEPWDLGPDGWRTGRFPVGIAQWNDRFRDCVRRFWGGEPGQVPELASRLAGSSDLFLDGPVSSVNFITSHDGFTLADLVSHERKHNVANGESNADGTDANWSRHWGVEGPTDDPAVLATRERVRRSLAATGILAQGITMLLAGDELGHSQGGNNNAYCQPRLIELDWALDARRQDLLDFMRRALRLYREQPVLRRSSFFRGTVDGPDPGHDVVWLGPDGRPMSIERWQDPDNRFLGMLLPGAGADERDGDGRLLSGDTLLLLLNGSAVDVELPPPSPTPAGRWELLLDSSDCPLDATFRAASAALPPTTAGTSRRLPATSAATGESLPTVRIPAHALLLLRWAHEP